MCGTNAGPISPTIDPGIHLDFRNLSIGAAVEFAKANNLLGIFVDADLLIQVPTLIHGIRNAGLLVGVYGPSGRSLTLGGSSSNVEGNIVDAFLGDGKVMFMDHTVRELI
jgi:CDK inhibitor PHO81